jgi:hypothetical protein
LTCLYFLFLLNGGCSVDCLDFFTSLHLCQCGVKWAVWFKGKNGKVSCTGQPQQRHWESGCQCGNC